VTWEKRLIAFADPDYEILNKNLQAINISVQKSMVDSAGKVYFDAYKKPGKDVAFKRLAHTRQEALEIARITNAPNQDIYLGKRASERLLYKAPLSSARYILFATHGIVPREDNGIPEPGLALAGDEYSFGPSGSDGLLTASEIMGLQLTAEMVVLSACETAGDTTSAIQGEGFLGLTRAFIFAGAANLLVSHWSIESSATQKFISTLFREKIENQRPNDISLHTTKRWMRSQTADFPGHPSGKISYAHPFFWAPFVLVATRNN
jgi:CHAT domain-containing protein